MAGLNNSSTQSLKSKWEQISEFSQQLFQIMDNMLSPVNNFLNYRKMIKEVSQKEEPYFPYLAVHFRDIGKKKNMKKNK